MSTNEFAAKLLDSEELSFADFEGSLTYSFSKREGMKRLKELMLFIADRFDSGERFGEQKLSRILFYTDFAAFKRWGEPVTGERYLARERGPAPERLVKSRRELIEAGDAALREHSVIDRVEERLVPLRDARLEVFSAREIDLVNQVVERVKSENGRSNGLAQRLVGWTVVEAGEPVPYECAYFYSRELSAGDVRQFDQLATEHGW